MLCCAPPRALLACIRWVRRGIDRLDASGGAHAQAEVLYGETDCCGIPSERARTSIDAGLSSKACCIVFKYVPKLLRCAGLQRAQVGLSRNAEFIGSFAENDAPSLCHATPRAL
jgi:hypothetical protein